MDSLTFDRTGGFPLNLQDLEFLHDGLTNVIKGLCEKQMKRTDTYTWFGNAKLEGATLQVSNGLFYDKTNDELFFIEGATLTDGSLTTNANTESHLKNCYLILDERLDDDGYKVFEDGDTWGVRKYRRIKFGTSAQATAAGGAYRGLTLYNLYTQRRGVESVSYGAVANNQDEEIYKIHRWKGVLTTTDYTFSSDDPYQEVKLVRYAGSATADITLPGENYPGDIITINNTSSYTVTVYDGRGNSIDTLTTGKGQMYFVNNYTWTGAGEYSIS